MKKKEIEVISIKDVKDIRYKFLNILLKEKNTIPLGKNEEEMKEILLKFFHDKDITNIDIGVERIYRKDHWLYGVCCPNGNNDEIYEKNLYAIYFKNKNERLSDNVSIAYNNPKNTARPKYTNISGNDNFIFYIGTQWPITAIAENDMSSINYSIDKKMTLKDAIINHYNCLCACEVLDVMSIYLYKVCHRKWSYSQYETTTKIYRKYIKKFKNLKFANTNISILQYIYEHIRSYDNCGNTHILLNQMIDDNIIKGNKENII